MVSYLTTLFLGKPSGGSLTVLSTHSFASNRQLALLESGKDGIFSTKGCARVDLGTPAYEAEIYRQSYCARYLVFVFSTKHILNKCFS